LHVVRGVLVLGYRVVKHWLILSFSGCVHATGLAQAAMSGGVAVKAGIGGGGSPGLAGQGTCPKVGDTAKAARRGSLDGAGARPLKYIGSRKVKNR